MIHLYLEIFYTIIESCALRKGEGENVLRKMRIGKLLGFDVIAIEIWKCLEERGILC